MAETSDLERAIAAFVLGGLSAGDEARVRERLQKDPAARRLEQQMRQTLGALGAWREAHEALPGPAIPRVRRSPLRFIIPLAAAAAVVVAAGAWLLVPRAAAPDLSGELAWTSTQVSLPKEMWAWEPPAPRPPEGGPKIGAPGDPKGGAPPPGGQGFGGAPQGGHRTGGPGGTDGGGAASGGPKPGRTGEGGMIGGAPDLGGGSGAPKVGAPPRGRAGAGAAPPRDLAAFVRQFDFAFRLPETLPGGWKLASAFPCGKSHLNLTYAAGSRTLRVFLAASPGPDVAPAAGPSLVAARRGGVLVAFSREAFPGDLRGKVIGGFLK